MLKKIIFLALCNLIAVSSTLAQMPAPVPASLDTILTEAQKQSANYQETFKNLLATEIKTFESYDDGEIDEKSVVESNLLIYQSSKNQRIASEVRNVVKVDDKLIPNSQAESEKFFAELAKEKTFESELEKIEKAGTRYDKTVEVTGMTVNEGIVLAENLRPYFDFNLLGMENYQGSQVYVVSYAQNKKSPFVTINGNNLANNQPNLDYKVDIPGGLKKRDVFVSGKMWIDAQNFQIRREERNLVLKADSDLPLVESTFDYQPSEYGILTPKMLTLTLNEIKKKDGRYSAVRDAKLTFDYSKFRKSDVEVIILDDPE